jgi:hypothetical protein
MVHGRGDRLLPQVPLGTRGNYGMRGMDLLDWKRNDNSSHHIVELVIPLCAQLMAVMAGDTGDGNGPVRKYRLKKTFVTFGNDSRIGLPGILCHRFQACPFELIRRPVFFVNWPQAGQPDTKPESEPLNFLTGHL